MKYYDFYKKYFDTLKDTTEQNVKCLLHDDDNPSLSINLENGKWYCHTCRKGGDMFQWYMEYHRVSFSKAKAEILGGHEDRDDILSVAEVEDAYNNLVKSENLQLMMKVKRGWTLETINKFKLGYRDDRVTIPIYDDKGMLQNIRKYDIFHKTKQKFKNVKGYGKVRIFPIENVKNDTIIFLAGEPDTILANQLGLPAVTFTGGEGTINRDYLPLLEGKEIFICYDIDETGKKASETLGKILVEIAKEVKIIHIPENYFQRIDQKNADFTDLFIYSIEKNISFDSLWNPIVELAEKVYKEEELDIEYKKLDFYEAISEKYYNKEIEIKAHVVGKNFSPFAAPSKITVTCDQNAGEQCKTCIVFFSGGVLEISIKPEDSLDLINCSSMDQRKKIRAMSGLPSKCGSFKTETKIKSIEEIIISPELNPDMMEQQFVTRKAFTLSSNIITNKIYSFRGKTLNDPKTQEITHLFCEQKPEIASLYDFELDEYKKKALEIFHPNISGSTESLQSKLDHIYSDFTFNVPGETIIQREKLMLAYDLVFFSVLSFNFPNEKAKVTKGWTELLILGDERTGKTKTAQKLIKHYKAGDYRTLEGATLPGLIGGVSQIGNQRFFGWGMLPLNDGHLVVLDEGNSLNKDGWADLSSIRDTGIAERTVVGMSRKTLARVRLIVLSNPRSSGKKIEHYTSGVEAIKDLIGKNEDIARFDFAMIVTQKDINEDDLNRESSYGGVREHVYTSELNSWLVQWAWSRKPHNVIFTKEAKRSILEKAGEMSKKYSDTIPLVQRSVQRIKIAKLSVALACRMFSTENGIDVIIKEEHVEFVVNFLESIYDSTYFGYDNYSTINAKDQKIEETADVKSEIFKMAFAKKFIDKMLSCNEILFEDLMDFTGYSRDRTKDLRKFLVEQNCIKRIKTWYVKQPEFISLLKKLDKEFKDREMFNDEI